MRAKPDLQEFIGGQGSSPAQQTRARVDMLRPSENQDRDDMDSEASQEHIRAIAESIKLRLPDGSRYGIRRPVEVRPLGDDGKHEIIAGENRWRAAILAGEADVPIIIRESGNELENRLDHVTDNALRRDLNLWQQACSIKRDQDEFGMTTDQVIIAHGLRNKSQLSKLMAVFKLSEAAQAFVKKGFCQDVNLVYDLKKLNEDQINKLTRRVVDKNESFPAALKATMPKEPATPKEPKQPKQEPGKTPGNESGGNSPLSSNESDTSLVKLALTQSAAKALAVLLDIEVSTEVSMDDLTAQLQEKISSLAEEGA